MSDYFCIYSQRGIEVDWFRAEDKTINEESTERLEENRENYVHVMDFCVIYSRESLYKPFTDDVFLIADNKNKRGLLFLIDWHIETIEAIAKGGMFRLYEFAVHKHDDKLYKLTPTLKSLILSRTKSTSFMHFKLGIFKTNRYEDIKVWVIRKIQQNHYLVLDRFKGIQELTFSFGIPTIKVNRTYLVRHVETHEKHFSDTIATTIDYCNLEKFSKRNPLFKRYRMKESHNSI